MKILFEMYYFDTLSPYIISVKTIFIFLKKENLAMSFSFLFFFFFFPVITQLLIYSRGTMSKIYLLSPPNMLDFSKFILFLSLWLDYSHNLSLLFVPL